MSTDRDRVIVEDAVCRSCGSHTIKIHHRDFPEVRAECGSVAEGLAYLAGRLACARDGVQGAWHREGIDLAIADLEEFVENSRGDCRERGMPCRCDYRTPADFSPFLSA